jgi:hypothetical protein
MLEATVNIGNIDSGRFNVALKVDDTAIGTV